MPTSIILAVEDDLSETVLRVILEQSNKKYDVVACYGRRGREYLRKMMNAFNSASRNFPHLVLTDLDSVDCPMMLINEWLPYPKNSKLIFRIAVREVEAWVMADRRAFADFLGIKVHLVPEQLDQVEDPKKLLFELTRKSRNRELKESILPLSGGISKVGPDYNGQLGFFVKEFWRVNLAIGHSLSLERANRAILNFIY